MNAYPPYGRLDPLAVIATELQAAADGDATAVATIIQAAHTGTVVTFDPIWYYGLVGAARP